MTMTKTITLAKALAAVAPGSSVAFGGGGIQRKPMAAARVSFSRMAINVLPKGDVITRRAPIKISRNSTATKP